MRVAAVLVAALVTAAGAASPAIEVGRFSAPADPGALPAGWEPLAFKKIPRATRYTVVRDGDGWVLKAESDASASGLYRPLDVDPRAYPRLTWRWRQPIMGPSTPTGDRSRQRPSSRAIRWIRCVASTGPISALAAPAMAGVPVTQLAHGALPDEPAVSQEGADHAYAVPATAAWSASSP